MNWSSFKYLCRQGFSNMVNNRLMSIASIGVLSACITIIGVAGLLGVNVNNFVNFLGGQSEIVVYVKDIESDIAWVDMTDEEKATQTALLDQRALEVEAGIKATPNVNEVDYVSKEEALAEQMEFMGEYSDLVEDFARERDVYPASFRVTVKDLEIIMDTAESFYAIDGVESCVTSQNLSSVLINLKNTVNFSSLALIGILILVSLVVISNTIRITVFARSKEINIMKFVGATNTFIRMPFLIEGMLVGFISAMIAFSIITGGYLFLINYLAKEALMVGIFTFELIPYSEIWLATLGLFVASGVIVGGLGSTISVKKHLKV